MKNEMKQAEAARAGLSAGWKTRPVRAPGLQAAGFSARMCRPRALTRRFGTVFKKALSRSDAVRQASRLSLTSSGYGAPQRRLIAVNVHLPVRQDIEVGDRRDACPTLLAPPSRRFLSAWIRLALAAFAVVLTAAAYGQGTVGPATLCAGAARLNNGSLVCLGQPFVGLSQAAGGALTLNAGVVPALVAAGQTSAPFPLSPTYDAQGGSFQVSFYGVAGRNYVFQASTNLTHWVALRTNTAGPGPVVFQDSQAGLFRRRFYRVQGQ